MPLSHSSAALQDGSRPARAAGRWPADPIALGILWLIPAAVTAYGLPYYLLERSERLRSPLHALLRPSSGLGLGLGIAGLALFLFMWLYPLRKSVRWLAWTGPLGTWLRVHSLAGLLLPLLVAVHAGWRFDGLIGLGYFSMVMVSLSGLVGRYLYAHIPRRRSGVEMSRDEVAAERRALITEIAAETGALPADIERVLGSRPRPAAGLGLLTALRQLVLDDLERRRAVRTLAARLRRPGPSGSALAPGAMKRVMALARREIALGQQMEMLQATGRVFAFWHVAHRPFAITALIAVLVHVAVAMAIGVVGP